MERFLLIDENGLVLDKVIAQSKDRARLCFDNTGWKDKGVVVSELDHLKEMIESDVHPNPEDRLT